MDANGYQTVATQLEPKPETPVEPEKDHLLVPEMPYRKQNKVRVVLPEGEEDDVVTTATEDDELDDGDTEDGLTPKKKQRFDKVTNYM